MQASIYIQQKSLIYQPQNDGSRIFRTRDDDNAGINN